MTMGTLFLLDENLSLQLAIYMEQLGYTAVSVRDIRLKGAEDIDLIEWAIKKDAVIITGDMDFGELWYWCYRGNLGVIVFKLTSYKIAPQQKIIKFLHESRVLLHEHIKHSLVISTEERYRIRTKKGNV